MKSKRPRYPKAILLAAMTALAAAPSLAGEGRIPLHQPSVIVMPGSYVVTRDITAMTGPIFDIQASGVSVDLNGHTLTVSNAADPVVKISSVMGVEPEPFRLANGTLRGGMHGIHALNTVPRTLSLSDLRILGAATSAVKADHVGDLEAKGIIVVDTKTGFELTGLRPPPDDIHPAAMIRDSMIHADIGVSCDGVVCGVMDSTIVSCGSGVRFMNAEGSEAEGNTFSLPGGNVCFNPQPEPPGDTIHLEGSPGARVSGNTLMGSPATTGSNHGITADDASRDAFIADNQITGYGNDGMHLMSSGNLIRGNLVNRNVGNGLWLGGMDSLVESNTLTANSGDGIVFEGPGNAYRANTLLSNRNAVSGAGLADTIDGGGNIQ